MHITLHSALSVPLSVRPLVGLSVFFINSISLSHLKSFKSILSYSKSISKSRTRLIVGHPRKAGSEGYFKKLSKPLFHWDHRHPLGPKQLLFYDFFEKCAAGAL